MAKVHAVDLGLTDVLDYMFDWSDWLVPGDTLALSNWVLPGDLISPHPSGISGDHTLVWLQIAQGTMVGSYEVINQIATTGDDAPESEPRYTERTLVVNVVDY